MNCQIHQLIDINVSSQQEQWEELSNNSMRIGHELRRAVADDPPRPAQLNTDQRVNARIADLGNEATARRSGGQGVYPPHYVNDNIQNLYGSNQYFSQTYL